MSARASTKHQIRTFGVTFEWSHEGFGSPGFDPSNLAEAKALDRSIREVVGDALSRQRRQGPAYWDGMTYLERVRPPKGAVPKEEYQLVQALIDSLHDPEEIDPATILSLSRLPSLQHMCTEIVPRKPLDEVQAAIGVEGRAYHHDSAYLRTIHFDMNGLEIDSLQIPWHRVLVLAILANLRADLEVYVETGYFRVRRCVRLACSAWYRADRMAGRQRFCSVACRVGHSRES